jgi:uncharacterized protein
VGFVRSLIWQMIPLMLAGAVIAACADVRLANAVQNQDKAAIRTLLAQHVDVDAAQVDGTSPLLWAAHNDDTDAAQLLLRAGANPRTPNRYGVFPLAEAATNGNAALIEMLVKAGADPNAALTEGDTPIMIASRLGSVAAARALLDLGAQPNAKEGWHGETALMWAAAENHPDVVRLLIERGADPNAQATPLVWPEMKTAPAQVMSKYPSGGLTALMQAAREDAIEAAQALLKGGANPNQQDPLKLTALIIATANAHFDLANLLLENGADPSDGSLMEAVDVRHSTFIRPAHRPDKMTAMDLINSLLAHGAKPDSAMPSLLPEKKALGGSPTVPVDAPAFYRASKSADLTVMQLLLEKGADAKRALKDGSTALTATAGVADAGPTSFGGEIPPKPAELIEAMKLCLDHGADINAVDEKGMTALHQAAGKGTDAIVQFLADRGAKLDLKDKKDRTALDVANGVPGAPGPMGPMPSIVHPSTVALLRKLMGLPEEPAKTTAEARPVTESSAGPKAP